MSRPKQQPIQKVVKDFMLEIVTHHSESYRIQSTESFVYDGTVILARILPIPPEQEKGILSSMSHRMTQWYPDLTISFLPVNSLFNYGEWDIKFNLPPQKNPGKDMRTKAEKLVAKKQLSQLVMEHATVSAQIADQRLDEFRTQLIRELEIINRAVLDDDTVTADPNADEEQSLTEADEFDWRLELGYEIPPAQAQWEIDFNAYWDGQRTKLGI